MPGAVPRLLRNAPRPGYHLAGGGPGRPCQLSADSIWPKFASLRTHPGTLAGGLEVLPSAPLTPRFSPHAQPPALPTQQAATVQETLAERLGAFSDSLSPHIFLTSFGEPLNEVYGVYPELRDHRRLAGW